MFFVNLLLLYWFPQKQLWSQVPSLPKEFNGTCDQETHPWLEVSSQSNNNNNNTITMVVYALLDNDDIPACQPLFIHTFVQPIVRVWCMATVAAWARGV